MTLQQICEKYKIDYSIENFIEVLKDIYYSIDPKGFFQALQDQEVILGESFFK